ncbi:hypothetical protein [Candidatus Laterigemmans baculatus]|uniref:hypothetical protein n=1 Tax=Candidatus Laterigemmans baculatus TaxID=2770505 RepID=UPI0013DA9C48|nr:hypothetical protein [Candidatus Laterigemmans baculatus]
MTILLGLGLCALTLFGLLSSTSGKIATAFIPMIFGIPLVIAGIVSLNPHRRRSWTAFACCLAAIGGLGAATRSAELVLDLITREPVQPLPMLIIVILAVSCLSYATTMSVVLWKSRRR